MNDWAPLKRVTAARIGLARAGAAVSTGELLAFQLAHAQARDAVWRAWDAQACAAALEKQGMATIVVQSRAEDRATYLKRPDLGRRLDAASMERLTDAQANAEVALMLSDGLSAAAVDAHGFATLHAIQMALAAAAVSCSPAVLARFGRVALSDEIGHALGARISVIVIGERPGLSAADSLGIYLTHAPAPGNSDAQRNCISNVREPGGLSPAIAATRLVNLLRRSLTLGVSGVQLKDGGPTLPGAT
jgi:ethanolamine ammonia-lyase small subunit